MMMGSGLHIQPLSKWQWVVVSGKTQFLNSNSKPGVQDPPQTWIELFRMHLFYLRGKGRRGDSGCVEGSGVKNSGEVLRASVPNSTIHKDARSNV